jgi:hypothetical protein
MGVGAVRRLDSDQPQSFEIEAESRPARLIVRRAVWRALIIAVIVLAVNACDQSAVAPSLADVVIIGRVLDYSTRTPVSSAAVTFTLLMEGTRRLPIRTAGIGSTSGVPLSVTSRWHDVSSVLRVDIALTRE